MRYVFLTGATGLLGTYLVRDWLKAGVNLAVLVRPTRYASARNRIETLVDHWEKQLGYALPRPVILEGHFQDATLGLDEGASRWVAANCEAVVHNAASLTFYAEEGRNSEPWTTNLDGTRNLLDYCRKVGLRDFHQVSTAYVCGQRRGRILETDVDVGQTPGNDYEASKLQSEEMVRNADFLKNVTVYRPGIIFGDSQSGYTTTYHGFYVPLKLVWTLIGKIAALGVPLDVLRDAIAQSGKRLLEVLNLTGNERKNFVPVDWVSAATTKVFLNPELHGRTYHLTPRNRVTVSQMQDVFQRVCIEWVAPMPTPEDTYDWQNFEKFFFDQMGVYKAYWQDDPEFDSSNTVAALPELLCPDIDEEMLLKMSRYAVEANFGWPRPPIVKPDFDVHSHLDDLLAARRTGTPHGDGARLGLQVNGRGGGQFELTVKEGQVVAAASGLTGRCTATFYLNSRTLERMTSRELSAAQAIGSGRVVIEGNGVPLDQLTSALQHVADREFALQSAT